MHPLVSCHYAVYFYISVVTHQAFSRHRRCGRRVSGCRTQRRRQCPGAETQAPAPASLGGPRPPGRKASVDVGPAAMFLETPLGSSPRPAVLEAAAWPFLPGAPCAADHAFLQTLVLKCEPDFLVLNPGRSDAKPLCSVYILVPDTVPGAG